MDQLPTRYEVREAAFDSEADRDAFVSQISADGYMEDGGTVAERGIVTFLIAGARWIVMYILLFYLA